MSIKNTNPDVIICLGMTPNEDGSLGKILKNRVDLAYDLAQKYDTTLILSGGRSHKRLKGSILGESGAMLNYLKSTYNLEGLNIIFRKNRSKHNSPAMQNQKTISSTTKMVQYRSRNRQGPSKKSQEYCGVDIWG